MQRYETSDENETLYENENEDENEDENNSSPYNPITL